jgi:outer membrane PBP1 activator LpoA protein
MLNGTGGAAAVVTAWARPACARWLPVLALLALAAAGCDQFSSERVAETCVRSALKDGEPYGSDVERRQAQEQLQRYCRAAAEGR